MRATTAMTGNAYTRTISQNADAPVYLMTATPLTLNLLKESDNERE
jgi:hypothetical protein